MCNWMRIRPWALVIAGAVLLAGVAVTTLGWLDTRQAAAGGWLYNANGYQQAVYRATQNGKPLLLWLQQGDCMRCQQLEQLWQTPQWQESTRDWLRVRLDGDADIATAQLLERYHQQAEFPVWILERTPQGETTALYFNADMTAFRVGAHGQTMTLTAEQLKAALDSWLLDSADEAVNSQATSPAAGSGPESETE